MGPLIDKKGELVKEPFLMAELLREQYESTFSQPDVDLNIEAMANFFKLADQVYENYILNEEHDDDREEAEMTEDENIIHDKN